ncbi:MAG: class II fructose-1,6-bisphosphate aldolase [Bacilli bacterium]
MITNSNQILKKAKQEKYAIPHFNIINLEWTKFILEECENNNSPVILGVSESAAKYMGGYKVVADLIKSLDVSLKITVPVVIHLDHGSSFQICKEAIDSGFTSVMIDASKFDLNSNIEITKKVKEYAKTEVSVEAEIGHIGGKEEENEKGINIAKVEEAIKLYENTKIDSLAPALGSIHGLYVGTPKLDFNKMKKISKKIDIPLVLHGGTGLNDTLLKQAINCGICKVNINTELQIAWSNEIKKYLIQNFNIYDPRLIIKSGEQAIKQVIKNKIQVLGSVGKASL